MSDSLISVIVPAYNCEKYIKKTLSIILKQSFDDFEVIVIDDGSTDSTLQIIKRIALLDSRVIVIEQKNVGVAAARNNGVQCAKGKYVVFIDADDEIDITMLEKLYLAISKNGCQIAMCGFRVFIVTPRKIDYVDYGLESMVLNNIQDKEIVQLINKKFLNVVWNKIIEKQFIIDNNLFFKNYNSGEDAVFCAHLLTKARRVAIIPDILYYYHQRPDGTLTTKFGTDKFDALLEFYDTLNKFCNKDRQITLDKQLDYILLKGIVSSLLSVGLIGNKISIDKKKSYIADILNKEQVQTMINRKNINGKMLHIPIYILKSRNTTIIYGFCKILSFVNRNFPLILERKKQLS